MVHIMVQQTVSYSKIRVHVRVYRTIKTWRSNTYPYSYCFDAYGTAQQNGAHDKDQMAQRTTKLHYNNIKIAFIFY